MKLVVLCFALAALASDASIGADFSLGFGTPAPQLAFDAFLRGGPVDEFNSGKVYVVEFSGTWCHACVELNPEMNELMKHHPQVTFLSVFTEPEEKVATFLKGPGEDIGGKRSSRPFRSHEEGVVRSCGREPISPCLHHRRRRDDSVGWTC